MWKFTVDQREFNIGGVKVGGNPGERPVVLIGTIFYHKHRVVTDEVSGKFDRKRAEELINEQDDFSERTGNPCMVDVVGSRPETMWAYLEFAANVTDAPLLLGGTAAEIRLAGLQRAAESGLVDRLVYNSLTPDFKREELEKIKEAGLRSVILLAYNVRDPTSRGRLEAIRGMLPAVWDAGVEKTLVDTCVIDLISFGQACRAVYDVKEEMGMPSGCGAHNAIATWKGLKKKMGEQAVKPALASVSAAAAAVGADFVLYGPIEDAKYVFPVVALMDAAYSQLVVEKRKPLDKKHPRYRIA